MSAHASPPLLICDSDALVQLFICQELRPLKLLRKAHNIQPAITMEVDTELRWLGKYKNRFVGPLEKTLKDSLLVHLDQRLFQSMLSDASPGTSWPSFQNLGGQYAKHVGRGEAFTFAAGVTLGLPALSNDFRAIQVLDGLGLSL